MNNPEDLTSKYITNENGDKMMYNDNNELHSFNDLPAVISRDGTQERIHIVAIACVKATICDPQYFITLL
jgi:hypothetical protein